MTPKNEFHNCFESLSNLFGNNDLWRTNVVTHLSFKN